MAKKELSTEELKNLAGFFDVLIQIDLEQKRKSDDADKTDQ